MRYTITSLLILFSFSIQAQNLQFFKEDLKFEIKDNYFYVSGIYYFCNTSDKEINQVLYYPFPKDTMAYGKADSIKVINLENNSKEKITKYNPNGIYFPVNVKPYKVAKYNISYRQKNLINKAEYILTTTQEWHKPFDRINYTLLFPNNYKIDSITYVPDSILKEKNFTIYKWNKKDFMPMKNMIIWYKNK